MAHVKYNFIQIKLQGQNVMSVNFYSKFISCKINKNNILKEEDLLEPKLDKVLDNDI